MNTIWDNAAFDREANSIAQAFWAGHDQNGATLNELVTKVARDNNFNPDQICRLARTTNKKAFEQKYAALKGEDDRNPTFPLADEEAVIEQLRTALATNTPKVAEALFPDIEDEFAPPVALSTSEKVAALLDETFASLPKPRPPTVQLARATKLAEELEIQRLQINDAWNDTLGELAKCARAIDWDHDEFEKNAIAMFGPEVLPELNYIRALTRRPQLGSDRDPVEVHEKLSSLQTTWIGVATPHNKELASAMALRRSYSEKLAEQADNKKQIASLRKLVRHG